MSGPSVAALQGQDQGLRPMSIHCAVQARQLPPCLARHCRARRLLGAKAQALHTGRTGKVSQFSAEVLDAVAVEAEATAHWNDNSGTPHTPPSR